MTARATARARSGRRRAHAAPSSASPRAGFTLVELMVGLSLGMIVLASIYTIGVASSRHFQEQQRISQLQLATRIALDRIRRDVSLAGFGGSPDSDAERAAARVAGVPRVVAVSLVDHDPAGMAALGALAGTSEAGVHSDSLRLSGNFDTSDVYLVRDYAGVTINLQTNWQGFRRSFMASADGLSIDSTLFSQVFARGRLVHIHHPVAGHLFAVISSSSADASGSSASITLESSLPSVVDVCLGCTIAPVSTIEYVITAATGPFVASDPTVTGPNTVLVRRELDVVTGTPIAGTERTILEWAVHFDADLFIDMRPLGGTIPDVRRFDDAAAAANGTTSPTRIRSIALSLSSRTPNMDERFPWVAPMAGAPLTRFRPFTDRAGAGACRVRTARAEILLPSVAYRGLP